MTRWEYMAEPARADYDASDADECGREGWELFAFHDGRAWYKRRLPKPEPRDGLPDSQR